jgi:hypothetical protein
MSTFDHQVSKRKITETQIEHTHLSFFDRLISFVIYLSYLNINNIIQIKFAKKCAELK